jgi:hypothetical protein
MELVEETKPTYWYIDCKEMEESVYRDYFKEYFYKKS